MQKEVGKSCALTGLCICDRSTTTDGRPWRLGQRGGPQGDLGAGNTLPPSLPLALMPALRAATVVWLRPLSCGTTLSPRRARAHVISSPHSSGLIVLGVGVTALLGSGWHLFGGSHTSSHPTSGPPGLHLMCVPRVQPRSRQSCCQGLPSARPPHLLAPSE